MSFINLDQGIVSLFAKVPNRKIGTFEGYVTISENEQNKLNITQHPIQDGASITDNAFKEPAKVSIRLVKGLSQSLTSFSLDSVKSLQQIYEEILQLQADRVPFDVVTGKKVYKDMLLEVVDLTTDKNSENILAINVTLQQIIIVQVVATTVPPRKKQKFPAKTGATENSGKKSALFVGSEIPRQLRGGI